MATKKISELTDGGNIAVGDALEVVRSGSSRKATFFDKLSDIVVPDADGTDESDDTSALQAAADACASTDKTLYIPPGSFRFTALDLREIKFIVCRGELVCTAEAPTEAVKLGTSINANSEMLWGDISLYVRHVSNSNDGLEGSTGIRIYGASHCVFRVAALFFEQGILVSPENEANLYFAFNTLAKCRAYGCATGLHVRTTGVENGWINENDFLGGSYSPATNALTEVAGIRISAAAGSSPNHNLFSHIHLESWTAPPILLENSLRNIFEWPRLESSAPIQIGNGTAVGTVAENRIITAYEQSGVKYPKIDWQAPFVNWALPQQGAEWSLLREITIDSWSQEGDGTGGRCDLLFNTVSEDSAFSAATFDGEAWILNSNHRGAVWVPVETGDIIAIDLDVASGTSYLTLRAQDVDKVSLSDLEEGDLPYIGSSSSSSIANCTSNTSASPPTITSSNYFGWQTVSINRDEVKYLKIEILNAVELRRFAVRKLVRNNAGASVGMPPVEPFAPPVVRILGTQTTVGSAGAASALPATPNGYIKMTVGGVVRVMPYYAAS